MFELIRKHSKFFMAVLFLLVIPSFVLFGIDSYTHLMGNAGKVASVNGTPITQAQWDEALRQQTDRMRQANPDADIAQLDTPQVKYALLEQLVRERVLAEAAIHENLAVSNEALARALREIPEIAALGKEGGQMDMQAYRDLLAHNGLTPEGFEAGLRQDLARQAVLGGITASAFTPAEMAGVSLNALMEPRQVQILQFKPADYAASVKPTDEELQAYYERHKAQYRTAEAASVEYLVLDAESLKKTITPAEDELRAYYEQNQHTLGKAEERQMAHILISAAKDAPAAEHEKARAAAAEILARVRAKPDAFAEEARQHSQDDISAPKGGDLGKFKRNANFDAALLNALFALPKQGDISDVVQSDFGYHILRLTQLTPAEVPPFEQVRGKIEDQFRTQEAQKRLAEITEDFRNGVFEQPDSLQPTADKLKLPVLRADGVTRTPAANATGPLASARFLQALFSPDALSKKNNTDAIETAPGQLAAGRIAQYHPAQDRPLAEVKDEVRRAYIAERAAALAAEDGQKRLQAWTAQPASAGGLPAAVAISRENPHGQPLAVVDAVLRADPAKLPAFVGVPLGAQGYALVRIEKVLPRTAPAEDAARQERQRYEQVWAATEAAAHYDELKRRYKAEIFAPKPAVTLELTR